MKFKYIPLLVLCSINFLSFAVLVKMPNGEIINKRLNEIGFEHFADNTGIADELADKELQANQIVTILKNSFHEYAKHMPRPELTVAQMEIDKPYILEALLQNSPEALQELEKQGLL